MPRKSISFELDFMTKDILPKFTVKQFDDISFNIKPKNQGLDYNTAGMTGKIFIGVNNDMFMQTKNITVSNNNVNILLDRNMLQKNGRAYAEIELTDSNGTISSSSFIFNIDEKIGEGAKIPGEYEGFVAKYERLISEFKSQVNETISNCNANVDNKLNTVDSLINVKISDFEKRFNRLTSSQQQDAEVIDARTDFKGVVFDSLKERIDYTDKLLRESTVSTVTTESDFTTVEATSNGYFEDVKLEGKTLVNLVEDKFAWSGNTSVRYSTIYLNHNFEVNKTYTLCVVNPPTNFDNMMFRYSVDNVIFNAIRSNITTFTVTNVVGTYPILYLYGTDLGEATNTKVIILEGDHTQNPPSYFEGLKSVGEGADEIVVSSVKGDGNLFDVDKIVSNYPEYFKCNDYIKYQNGVNATYLKQDFEPNTQYSFTIKASSNKANNLDFTCRYTDNTLDTFIISNTVTNEVHTQSFISAKGKTIKSFGSFYSDSSIITLYLDGTCINKGDTPKPYEPHQADKKRLLFYNNETQTWEKPVLREWDSIEKHSDGKYYYHQRSGEVVLNGNEFWELRPQSDSQDVIAFNGSGLTTSSNVLGVVCDKFPTIEAFGEGANFENVFIATSTRMQIRVLKSKLSTQDVAGFKQWLQANNITVVYQLAEEKVYECTNIDLITYTNETNYIVECGAISPKSTLKVHNNISNVVSLLQKKVSLLESNITNYMITQNRMQLASTYSADSVTFKVDYALCSEEVEYNEDLYNLILNNILVGKDNYNYDKMFTMVLDYASWNQISWEQFDILVGLMDMQHNPPVEEIPTEDEVIEETPNEIM